MMMMKIIGELDSWELNSNWREEATTTITRRSSMGKLAFILMIISADGNTVERTVRVTELQCKAAVDNMPHKTFPNLKVMCVGKDGEVYKNWENK